MASQPSRVRAKCAAGAAASTRSLSSTSARRRSCCTGSGEASRAKGEDELASLLPFPLPLCPLLELQLHVDRAWQRAVIVGGDLAKAEGAVELARLDHRLERVEHQPAIADRARGLDDRGGERLAEAAPAFRRPHVKTFHFAGARVESSQRDAADRRIPAGEQEEASIGRNVLPGQRCELALEVLEPEVDADPPGVFAEQAPHVVEPRRVGRVDERVRRLERGAHRLCSRMSSAVSIAQLASEAASVAMIRSRSTGSFSCDSLNRESSRVTVIVKETIAPSIRSMYSRGRSWKRA